MINFQGSVNVLRGKGNQLLTLLLKLVYITGSSNILVDRRKLIVQNKSVCWFHKRGFTKKKCLCWIWFWNSQ